MDTYFVFGVDYKSSDLELRENLALSPESVPHVLSRLQNSGITSEVVILSTCNRTEIYCITQDIDFVINSLCSIQNICPQRVKQSSYIYSGAECAEHLFKVVSGLESMILGETEIVAQTKQAINLSRQNNSLHSNLDGLFQMALSVAKTARNKTGINGIAISIGHAVMDLVMLNLNNLVDSSVLFVGAGQIIKQIAPYFANENFTKKMILNRTVKNAETLATRLNADFAGLTELKNVSSDFSIIIACCNSDEAILRQDIFSQKIKDNKKLLIIDLSMPLITETSLRELPNITFYSIDAIARIVDVGLVKRKNAALQAHSIIASKVLEYTKLLKRRDLSPIISLLRLHAEAIRQETLLKVYQQLKKGESPKKLLAQLSIELTDRLLHEPVTNIGLQDTNHKEINHLISKLYNLTSSALQ